MNTNKILLAGLAGAVAMFVTGSAIHFASADFFANNAGTATGVEKAPEELLWLPIILGHIAGVLFLSYIFGRWTNIITFPTGVKAGAIIGLLFSATTGFIDYGATNLYTPISLIANLVWGTAIFALMGGVVAIVLGRKTKASQHTSASVA